MGNVYHSTLSGTDLHFTTGDKLSNLASIPAGAGDIPSVNLDGNGVVLTGDQTVAGIKTFSSIPVLPASDPTSDNQAARKVYVDGVWADYSATSTIVGWSSFTTKVIYIKKIGKTVFMSFYLDGTSNVTNITFTVPYANVLSNSIGGVLPEAKDNGIWETVPAKLMLPAGGTTITIYRDCVGTAFTASGAKACMGQFWYESA